MCRASNPDWNALEASFDLFLQCGKLEQDIYGADKGPKRAADWLLGLDVEPRSPLVAPPSIEVFRKGAHLEKRLDVFQSMLSNQRPSGETAVAQIYFHALSIYLSELLNDGVASHAGHLAAVLPALKIRSHREGVISLTKEALEHRRISPVLLLVPFRMAGYRCMDLDLCRQMLDLVCEIEKSYAVAGTIRGELTYVWRGRGLDI